MLLWLLLLPVRRLVGVGAAVVTVEMMGEGPPVISMSGTVMGVLMRNGVGVGVVVVVVF